MTSLYSRYLLFFMLLFPLAITAQTRQVKFTPFLGTNGISMGKINAMTRDKFGFLWFSDQSNRCIIRFDGNHMTRYQNDPRNPNSLGSYYPECLFADSAGNIWIGFYGMGFDKFDPYSNTFTHYRHKKDDPESLGDDFVTSILIDHLGNAWIGNYGGVDLFDQKTGKFRHFSNKPGDTTSLSDNRVRAIYEDRKGELWIGTGFAFDTSKTGGLNRFNRKTGTFTRYLHDPKNPNSLIDNKVRSIFEDSYGNFWVGTRGDGLHTLDRKTGLFTRYLYNPSKPGQLSRNPIVNPADHITFITEDADRKIWIGTLANGLSRYDPVTKEIHRYGTIGDKSGELNDHSSWWALSTAEGLIWYSTQSANLFRIDVFNPSIPFVSMDDQSHVLGFNEEDTSVLWMATSVGLLKKDIKTGAIQRIINKADNKGSLGDSYINVIRKDRKGNFWIGTGFGLSHFDPRSGIFTRYKLDNPPDRSGVPVISLFIDSMGMIWAGTIDAGLFMLDPESGKQVNYRNVPGDNNSISDNIITAIAEDSATGLWIGTANNTGLNRMDRKTGKFSRYLSGLTITAMHRDNGGDIWVASQSGLFRYDRETDDFNTNKTGNAGFSINEISSLINDDENNLWIAAETGIYKLNKDRNQLFRYGRDNGVNDADNFFFYGASFKSKNGTIYFGKALGYYDFDPLTLKSTHGTPQLYFTNFWLKNTELNASDLQLPGKSIFSIGEMDLRHDQNNFSFSSTIVDLRNSGTNIYYQLESYDKDWRITSAEQRISYYNVPPGTYNLRIKAANVNTGEWLEKSIKIIISPPWWKTTWAYIFYGLAILSLLFLVDRIQRKRIIEKERIRSREKELEQAKEIETAYHELKATQAQLLQSEKMASLGELTAGIAHEIQNPLNFVNNFADVNRELVEEMKEEINKGNYDEVKNIAAGIEDNSEKISEHGKRADSIVKSMLQHSRISAGQEEPTDINAMADEYLRLAYHGLRAKDKSFNARLTTDFDPSIGTINIVPQDIGRVLLNLINNAFYAVSEKQAKHPVGYEPTVSLSTRLISDQSEIRNPQSVIVSVKDNGSGIPQKVLDKIFQPFFTTKPAGQGTGLGLSLSYDIIKAHGGELKVETREGEGSEFIIILPVK